MKYKLDKLTEAESTILRLYIIAFIVFFMLLLQGCYLQAVPDDNEPVYKYNAMEGRQELTHKESKLKYNVYSREWVYVK